MSETQRYTYYAWLDADGLIRESGFAPTEALGDYPRWQRDGLRYVEHSVPELVAEATHHFVDGTIKRRERPEHAAAAVAAFDGPPPAPIPPEWRSRHGYH